MSFRRLGVCPEIVELLRDKGIIVPSEVQLGCIPPILEGNDIIACAQTGSGKTAAFVIPILQALMSEPRPFYALIITPTRELAHQIGEQTAGLNLVQGSPICTVQVITGGRNIVQQSVQLSQGPHVVVATPGRLADLLRTQKAAGPNSEQEWSLSRLKVLVLDEADRLLEDNFGKDLAEIMTSLPKVRQSLLFSATFSPAIKTAVEAARMKALSENRRPPLVWQAKGIEAVAPGATAATVDTLSQHYLITKPELKEAFLVYIVDQFLTESPHSLIIIFSNKCKWCHLLGLIMSAVGIQSAVLHSSMPQRDRITALTSFKSSHIRVLIATDLASRGLDFPTVDVVINHNVPIRPKDYVHRVGRTARAGKAGMALTLADLFEIKRLRAIQTYIGKKLQRFEVNESQVAKIIAEVTIARRNAERKLDELRFDEKREIIKAKNLLKAQSSKKMT
uniref:RNA helicase n=1 Tax=Schistocephalus solidus TaxID=70667 RepID=A0A0X3PG96_SCHSO